MIYNFDEIVNRRNTMSLKWDSDESNILPMWVADMDFRTALPIREALKKRAEEGIFGYSVFNDDVFDSVINWFRKRHNWEIKKEWLTYSQGIVPAIYSFIKLFVKPGEKVLMHTPVYYPFSKAAKRLGAEPVKSELIYKNGRYEIDFDDFEKKAADPAVKLFLLCSPHNPGGRLWTREELTRLGRICTDNNVLIVADEIHCDLVYPGNEHISFGTLDKDIAYNSIICTSPSKTFNLAGLQLSMLIIQNPELKDAYVNHIVCSGFDIDSFEASTFGIEGIKAAYDGGEEWLDQLLIYIDGNLKFLMDYIEKRLPRIKIMKPDATYLVWMDLSDYNTDYVELHNRLKYEGGLWLDEGYMFGKAGAGFERINIACPRAILEEALNRLESFLNTNYN